MISIIPRRQRWASFSVRAHLDYRSLATEILLYDRLLLPYPETSEERERWAKSDWDPDHLDRVYVQSGDLIVLVPWTEPMREEFDERMATLESLGREVAYGETARIYAAWADSNREDLWGQIVEGLDPGTAPELRPHVVAAYQSKEEALAGQMVVGEPSQLDPADYRAVKPGSRAVDTHAAILIEKLLAEPDTADDGAPSATYERQAEELFLTAAGLARSDRFRRARTALFELEDRLYTDGWSEQEVIEILNDLEADYNNAVKEYVKNTRRRQVGTILPEAAGGFMTVGKLTGVVPPVPNIAVKKPIQMLSGRFLDIAADSDPADHPGAMISLVRAAYHSEAA